MTVRVTLALLVAALVSIAASCSSNVALERTTSARGIVTCKPSSGGTGSAGRGATIYFYDDGSSSTAGPIVGWEWNFGSGWENATQTQGMLPHVFADSGNYQVQCRMTDALGNSGTGKLLIKIKDKYDAAPVFVVFGCDEGSAEERGSDGTVLRYHTWRWRTLAYDPEHAEIRESPTLAVSRVADPGDPDFDLLRVILSTGDPAVDFCGIDTDGDGVGDDLDFDREDDDPSLKRTYSFPHVLETSGRCLSKSKEDVYVWKVKAIGANGEGRKEYVGHVTLLK